MAPRERLGRLVLLDELEVGALGREHRAARLGPVGLDRLVSVLRFSPAISAHPDVARRLVEAARDFARPTHSGLVRLLGAGRVGPSLYVTSEPVEGRSVAAVLARSRSEGFPFAAEHALMIARRAAAALESLHAKKDGSGGALFHGLLTASRVVVSYDGEVKLRGLGLWRPLRDTGLVPEEERRYLSPEQTAGGPGGPACDVHALSLVLLEALTGALPDGSDPVDGLASARLVTSSGERAPLPPPLAALLRRALAREPGSRLSGAAELGRELDGLLFSGDFTPTTFDLAFFMHTLFRDDMEREARAVEEALHADYGAFVAGEPGDGGGAPEAVDPPATDAPPVAAEAARPAEPARPPTRGADAPGVRPAIPRAVREKGAREAAARLTFGAEAAGSGGRRGLGLVLVLLAALALGGAAGYLSFVKGRVRGPFLASAPAEESPGAQRIRELEARIAELEREKEEAEARAADEARRSVEAEAAAAGASPDATAVLAAEEEARRRARLDQERRQRQERLRLEEERQAEERRLAEATPPPTPEPTPTPPPTPAAADFDPPPAPVEEPAPPPTTVPPVVRRGALVELGDPGLTPPVIVRKPDPEYPKIARTARASGVVELRALVDENGRVVDVSIVRSTRPGVRFEESAVSAVRARQYRPGTKDGVAVRVWVPIEIQFVLP